MTGESRADPGLQPERTELAWRRTVLALLVGALLSVRLLPPALGAWSFGAALQLLVLTALLWVLARRRARLVRRALPHTQPLPGGGALLLVAVVLSGGAALAVAYVVST